MEDTHDHPESNFSFLLNEQNFLIKDAFGKELNQLALLNHFHVAIYLFKVISNFYGTLS